METLFFENAQGEYRAIGDVKDMTNAFGLMHQFCKERNFKIYSVQYYITETESGRWQLTFDVGSWSEFFHIYFNTFKEADAFRATAD